MTNNHKDTLYTVICDINRAIKSNRQNSRYLGGIILELTKLHNKDQEEIKATINEIIKDLEDIQEFIATFNNELHYARLALTEEFELN